MFTTCTAATSDSTVGSHLQADETSRSNQGCGRRSHDTSRISAPTRTRLRAAQHSCVMTPGRCHDRSCWTADRCGPGRTHRGRRYPSTRPPAACSCLLRTVLWTCCTRRSTTCRCSVTASRTSACTCHFLSAKSARCCRSSSCLQCRQNHACTRPTYDWTRCWMRWCVAGSE